MKTRIHLFLFPALFIFVSGCVTPPAANDRTGVSAYSVGDRACVTFDEVVVSLRMKGSPAPYQNLHVTPAAFVNPKKATYLSSAYDAEHILQRLQSRVAARLSEMLSGLGEQSLTDTEALRQKILTETQAVVDEALLQWEHGSDYRVVMVIPSLYWTDASVGRSQPQNRWLW